MAETDRISGLEVAQALKAPVKAATTANITLSAAQTIDGISCTAGDRVLVKDQTTGSEDGIYLVQTGAWTRAKDWNGQRDATQGTLVTVKQGTISANSMFRTSASDDPYVIDTVDPTFVLAEYLVDISGRYTFTFDSDTTMSEAPGDGEFRLNHATVGSATAMVFSPTTSDDGAPDISDFMMTWDDSTNSGLRGTVTISELGNPAVFATFSITAAMTDGTTYVDMGTIAYVDGSGAFAAGNKYVVSFARTGNLGGAGGGVVMTWESDTDDTDKGQGMVWANAGNTILYIDDLNAGGTSINDWIDSWDDGSNRDVRGTVTISSPAAPENYHMFDVTGGVESASTYSKVTVTLIDSGGTISDADSILMAFVRSGQKGNSAGVQMIWDTSTADSDQGAGKVWMNAAEGSATIIYMDDVDNASGASIDAWVESWDDSTATIAGHVEITKMSDPSVWRLYNVTGAVIDKTGYNAVTVTYVSGSGSFGADHQLAVNFVRSGDDGGGGTMSDWVDDNTPQAGGDVDMNTFDLLFDDAKGIRDDSDNEQLIFQKTASAVNHLEVTNAATGNAPSVAAVGGDADVDLRWLTKGDGVHDFSGAAVRSDIVALTSTSNAIAVDLADGNFYSHTLTENSSMSNPSNMPVGKTQEVTFFISQNSTAYTLEWGTFYNVIGATIAAIGTGTGVECRVDAIARSSTFIDIVITNGTT